MDGSAFNGVFEGIAALITFLAVMCLIFVPLGLWKLIEIAVWLYHHVSINLT